MLPYSILVVIIYEFIGRHNRRIGQLKVQYSDL